jgi:hypothetical protein
VFLSTSGERYMREVFRWAFAEGEKGDEYNYVVAGREGTVFEWAGRFTSAHCTDWNRAAVGVQFGLDVNDDMPEVYVERVQELRRHLVATGILHPDHRVGPHYEYLRTMPPTPWPVGGPADKGTTCWGNHVERHRHMLLSPLTAGPAPSVAVRIAPSGDGSQPVGFPGDGRPGASESVTRAWQDLYIRHGVISDNADNRDGFWGRGMTDATRRLQLGWGWEDADGRAGPHTFDHLTTRPCRRCGK